MRTKKTNTKLIMKYNNIRMITALVLGSLVAVSALNAQEKPRKHNRPEGAPAGERRHAPDGEAAKERRAKMAEELNLTDEQKTKIQAVMKEQAEQRKELRDA
jgi:Spy/CpxP family protein refolding chaperone